MTDRPASEAGPPIWYPDLDALGFLPPGHAGTCFVHRLAFRILIGRDPDPAACEIFFQAEREAFAAAASSKIADRQLPPEANFHLTSRDIRAFSGEVAPVHR